MPPAFGRRCLLQRLATVNEVNDNAKVAEVDDDSFFQDGTTTSPWASVGASTLVDAVATATGS